MDAGSLDSRVRAAAAAFLTRETSLHGEVLPWSVLSSGFTFDGTRVPLIGPQGIIEALKETLRIDLEQSPHLWQSAHFFVPRPILRQLSSRLDSDENSGDRAIFLNLVPRLGASLDKLTVEILETRPTGTRLLARARPTSTFLRIPLSEDVDQTTVRVVHDELGLLAEEGPYVFLRAISGSIELITQHRRVTLPERKDRPAEMHKIPIAGRAQTFLTGSERGLSASRILHQATTRRGSTPSVRQIWFRDNPLAAEKEVRHIIGAAKTKVLVVDPYFTEFGASLYLPWVTGAGVQNEILTSSGGLRGISVSGESGEQDENKRARRELAHLAGLSNELDQALAARRINATLVKVMAGKRPPIHDRFLVVDDKVWLLGSSLNEFGTRGTMMVELPSPDKVIPELIKVWDSSAGLDARIQHLRQELGEEK